MPRQGARQTTQGRVAGDDVNRLPLAVPSMAGEQAASWLSRAAARYGLTPSLLLAELDATAPSWSPARAQAYVNQHGRALRQRLGGPAATGLGDANLDRRVGDGDLRTGGEYLQLALADYQASYARFGAPRRPPTSGSRFCPSCLAATGGVWRRSWASPAHLVCQTHRVLLVPRCPGCGQVPWSTPAWAARPLPGWACTEHIPPTPPAPPPGWPAARPTTTGRRAAGIEPHRARRGWCGHDLRASGAELADDGDVEAQQRLFDAARAAVVDPDGRLLVCGVPTDRREMFEALAELVGEHQRSHVDIWRIGRDPRLLLDSLTAALRVLGAPDPAAAVAAADCAGVLTPAGKHTPLYCDSRLLRRAHSPLLGGIRLRTALAANTLSPTAQLTFRAGSGRPRYPEPGVRCQHHAAPGRRGQLPLRVIPQLLWPGLLTPFLTAHDHRENPSSPLGAADEQTEPAVGSGSAEPRVVERACAAMFLARLGSTRPWSLIAVELGMPAWFADSPPALQARLRRRGQWQQFLTALDDLAQLLEDDVPPVDYRTRRRLCADPRRLLAAVRAGRALTGDLPRPAVPDALLARAFWQVYTGGDLLLALPILALPTGGQRQACQQQVAALLPAATPTLLAVQTVLEGRGMTGPTGPLRWHPLPDHRTDPTPTAAERAALLRSLRCQHDDGLRTLHDDVALDAALAAAEQPLVKSTFHRWLWRFLDVNYGIPHTEDNEDWQDTVWALRDALLRPGTDPATVHHAALAAALRHTTRTAQGRVQRWRLLTDPDPPRVTPGAE